MIEIEDLVKHYGDKEAVAGINLQVADGEIYGFLGPNGAGKTTTIRMIVGLLAATAGTIRVAGFDLARDALAIKAQLGYIPDRPYVYEKLTGWEFLRFTGELYGMDAERIRRQGSLWLERFGLAEDAGRLTENYSHGMRQKLVFCACFLHEPRLVVVDEPMVGLDPRSARLLKDILREKARAGMTVFLSTHTLSVAEELCDRVGIIHRGRIIAEGSPVALRQQVATADGESGRDLESAFLRLTEEGEADAGRWMQPEEEAES